MPAMVTAGELMVARAGSVTPAHFPDEEFDLYSIPAHDRGSSEITVGRAIGSAKQLVRPGDVLLSKIVPHIRRAWVVGPNRGHRMIASGEWIVFRDERLNTRYLRHVLLGDPFHVQFMSTVAGVGGSLLRARPAFVAKIQIPLPTLEDQRRIAAILDQADALRARRREALAHLDDLIQSIFLDMFGDPVANAAGRPMKKLAVLTSKIGSGATPRGGEAAYKKSGVSLIRSMNVRDEGFTRKGLAFIDAQQAQALAGVTVEAGDVLLNITGASVARVTHVPADVLPARVNQHVAILRPTPEISAVFLERLLLTPQMKAKLLSVGGSGATREAITKSEIEGLDIIVPTRGEQVIFTEQMSAAEGLRQRNHVAESVLDGLFASLQSQAFEGEL